MVGYLNGLLSKLAKMTSKLIQWRFRGKLNWRKGRRTIVGWLVGWFMVFNATLNGTTSLAALLRRHELIFVCVI